MVSFVYNLFLPIIHPPDKAVAIRAGGSVVGMPVVCPALRKCPALRSRGLHGGCLGAPQEWRSRDGKPKTARNIIIGTAPFGAVLPVAIYLPTASCAAPLQPDMVVIHLCAPVADVLLHGFHSVVGDYFSRLQRLARNLHDTLQFADFAL